MQLHQAIIKIKNALSDKWCRDLVQYIDINCKAKAKVLVDGKDVEDTKQRNVYSYGLNSQNAKDDLYIKVLVDVMQKALLEYTKTFNYLRQANIQDINLLKYETGNFYNTHIDAFHTVNRQLSFIINLNNNYEGGELVFYKPIEKTAYSKVSLQQGDLMLFPSNFLYPHRILPITKGVRYSMVSWFA